jgi:hypothetical protein
MALGTGIGSAGLDDPRVLLGDRLRKGSLYRLLADHGHQMFPDGYFADLFTESAKDRQAYGGGPGGGHGDVAAGV